MLILIGLMSVMKNWYNSITRTVLTILKILHSLSISQLQSLRLFSQIIWNTWQFLLLRAKEHNDKDVHHGGFEAKHYWGWGTPKESINWIESLQNNLVHGSCYNWTSRFFAIPSKMGTKKLPQPASMCHFKEFSQFLISILFCRAVCFRIGGNHIHQL